jgi:hypothetical protein
MPPGLSTDVPCGGPHDDFCSRACTDVVIGRFVGAGLVELILARASTPNDQRISITDLDDYQPIDAEPGSYRLYSRGSPEVRMISCGADSG